MPTPSFGTRFFIILLIRALREYGRHQASIQADFPPEALTAIETLASLADVISAINEPGPL